MIFLGIANQLHPCVSERRDFKNTAMPRKKKPFNLVEALQRLQNTGVSLADASANVPEEELDLLPSIDDRIQRIINIVNRPKRKPGEMIFFVMYDIEDNRVRRLIVKYLEQKGCHRVQKSIFLADLPTADYNAIRDDLAQVQASYDNADSILVVPISTDYLNSMKVIGKSINIDLILKTRNTLFF